VRGTAGGEPREFASGFHFSQFALVAFAPDAKHLLSSFAPGGDAHFGGYALTLSVLATGGPVRFFWGEGDPFTSVAYSPDGNLLAAGSESGRVRLWTARGRVVRVLDGHKGAVRSLSFAADGKTLATAGEDGTARLWELATGQERALLTGHRGGVLAVALAPDGHTLATGGSDGLALLWKLSELGRAAGGR
jgi:WD40 repeat protein